MKVDVDFDDQAGVMLAEPSPRLSFRRNLFQFWRAIPVLKRIPSE
jgi:hypothetical protein